MSTHILTKDETWINKKDLFEDFDRIPNAIIDDELRFKINNYFLSRIPRDQKKQKQVEIYQKANKIMSSFKVIIYFTDDEHKRVIAILNRIGLNGKENLVLIDGRNVHKVSASNA